MKNPIQTIVDALRSRVIAPTEPKPEPLPTEDQLDWAESMFGTLS